MIPEFSFTRTPNIYFGPGQVNKLDNIIPAFGKNVLLVTGNHSIRNSGKLDKIFKSLKNCSIKYYHKSIQGEPSPDLIDKIVDEFKNQPIDVVLAIGGGSVIDAGKAISAMMPQKGSVLDYLEGVGTKIHGGKKKPFIAIPTTAGTGSEATKNAVLSKIGTSGFKKSLRHDNLVPNIAIIDPELSLSCPIQITASCGMDAFTQLLESYVSTKSSPLTDALAFSGLEYFKDYFIAACMNGFENIKARAGMAYASFISGLTLANAGLGIVHGFASSIGGFFNIPHGVICGSLIGPATEININRLKEINNFSDNNSVYNKIYTNNALPSNKDTLTNDAQNNNALNKYAKVGALLAGSKDRDSDYYCELLIKKLYEWAKLFKLNDLKEYGFDILSVDKIIQNTKNKNNPIELNSDDKKKILQNRIL